MAPEVMREKEYFKNADIYSLGVVLYEMFFSKMVFSGNFVDQLRENQKKA